MYDLAPESWQDWAGLGFGLAIVLVIAWRVARTPPM